jgi:hypothetical protein
MTRFTHIAGTVLGAAGRPVPLADAAGLIRAWALAALEAETFGRRRLARLYARDALALHAAAEAAHRWRRAAGWPDPLAADRTFTVIPDGAAQRRRSGTAKGAALSLGPG